MERDPAIVALPTDAPVWGRVFTVAPLVLVGTLDPSGAPDLAPKHMAMPLGWSNYFAFVCSPRHGTYANAVARGAFTSAIPRPTRSSRRASRPRVASRTTRSRRWPRSTRSPRTSSTACWSPAARFWLECELDRTLDGFGENSLVIGRVVAAAAHEQALREADRDDGDVIHELPLLAFLSPGRFARIDASNAFPFPADFRL